MLRRVVFLFASAVAFAPASRLQRRAVAPRFATNARARSPVPSPSTAPPADEVAASMTELARREIARARPPLAAEDAWLAALDLEAFRRDVAALGERLRRAQGEDDLAHLRKMCRWSGGCLALGLLTLWLPPNPLTVLALSTHTYSRWAVIAHHVCHGGYHAGAARDARGRFDAKRFAAGGVVRRAADWLDWMLPEAWNVEHNHLHHYRLGEDGDPDLVERNLEFVHRNAKLPLRARYALVGALALVWKWFYYAPNTYKELKVAERRRDGEDVEALNPGAACTLKDFFPGAVERARQRGKTLTRWFSLPELVTRVIGPYFVARFALLPAPLLLVPGRGPRLFARAVANLALAELLTNLHAFATIVTNHCGDDLYRFETSCKPRSGTFYLRQVVSSANYPAGPAQRAVPADAFDFAHGFLNYQVEHHLWPNLSALSYQRAHPELKAICAKHGVPFVQQSVPARLRKTIDVMVGKTSMRVFPRAYEHAPDLMTWRSDGAGSQ